MLHGACCGRALGNHLLEIDVKIAAERALCDYTGFQSYCPVAGVLAASTNRIH
jgi:hypothetical protein